MQRSNMFVNEKVISERYEDVAIDLKPRSTYIVIDWDDTLFPTSWLTQQGLSLESYIVPRSASVLLEKLDQTVVAFLRKASVLYGHVLIITNAQPQWVELSSSKFMPQTHELLFSIFADDSDHSVFSFSSSSSGFQNQELNLSCNNNWMEVEEKLSVISEPAESRIKVYSSRALFEKDFPNDPSAWKQHAFNKLLRSKISSRFFRNDLVRYKSYSESELDISMTDIPKKGLKRSLSSLSISSSDLNNLVEEESYEVEMDFNETDSFFSIDFDSVNRLDTDNGVGEFEHRSMDNTLDISPTEEVKTKTEFCNLLSIGDCFHDCESLRKLDIGLLPNTYLKKTVKFVEFPTLTQLQSEIDGLGNSLDKIVKLRNDCNLIVDKKHLG